MRIKIVLLTILLSFQSIFADEYSNDTVRFEPKQLIAPGALITVGALGVGIKPLVKARKWINSEIGVHKCSPADDVIQYLPLVCYACLDYSGVPARRSVNDRLVVGLTAGVIFAAVTNTVKYTVYERRPTGSRHNSFPSGHTGTAFLGAELMRQEYGTWAGVAGYTIATGVVVIRILNGRHWLNEVLAGSGIGILSARAGEWLLPFNRRWLGLDGSRGEQLVICPSYIPQTQTAALTAAIVF